MENFHSPWVGSPPVRCHPCLHQCYHLDSKRHMPDGTWGNGCRKHHLPTEKRGEISSRRKQITFGLTRKGLEKYRGGYFSVQLGGVSFFFWGGWGWGEGSKPQVLLGLDGMTARCIIAEAVIGKQPNPQPFVERPDGWL